MNLPTLIICLILAVIVIFDIRYLLKNGIAGCTGDCRGCGSTCRISNDLKKVQRRMKWQRRIRKLFNS